VAILKDGTNRFQDKIKSGIVHENNFGMKLILIIYQFKLILWGISVIFMVLYMVFD
jgi:hypothetical protein